MAMQETLGRVDHCAKTAALGLRLERGRQPLNRCVEAYERQLTVFSTVLIF